VLTIHALFARKVQRKLTNGVRKGRDAGRRSELRIPGIAAQTRMVSRAQHSAGFPQISANFKRIICHDVSEFESNMPSHAVCSLWVMSGLWNYAQQGPDHDQTSI
jgi:hypothetical protein